VHRLPPRVIKTING